nr:hypothetical protein Iba_chr15cCG6870 [Ipomoea batatas]
MVRHLRGWRLIVPLDGRTGSQGDTAGRGCGALIERLLATSGGMIRGWELQWVTRQSSLAAWAVRSEKDGSMAGEDGCSRFGIVRRSSGIMISWRLGVEDGVEAEVWQEYNITN